jgi:hypothetical protein
MDPCDDTLEDPLLGGDGDGVAGNKLCHLIPGLRAVLPTSRKLGRITQNRLKKESGWTHQRSKVGQVLTEIYQNFILYSNRRKMLFMKEMFFPLAEYFHRSGLKVMSCGSNMGCGSKSILDTIQIRQSGMKWADSIFCNQKNYKGRIHFRLGSCVENPGTESRQ